MALKRFTGLILLFAAISGCSREQSDQIVLQREWTANAEYAGDVWAAASSKAANGPVIDVREGAEALDPIKAVRSGAAQIGVASADRVLRDNEGGGNLVILAAATYKSPVVFLSHPQAQIARPEDFKKKGVIVGIQTGTNTELVFKSLLASQNIRLEDVRVVESGWGTQSFETGAITVLAAFDYDEPVQLRRKSRAFNTLRPEDYGINYVGTVYFTSRQFATANPQAVQSFMNALVDGWRHALADPAAAIQRLKARFPAMDADKELESFKQGAPYFQGEGGDLLYASRERWISMARNLNALGLLKQFNFDSNVDYRFLENANQRHVSK